MLINTVILFIRDMAPIFLLFAMLFSHQQMRLSSLSAGIAIGFVLAAVLYINLGVVSSLADGGGLELLKTLLLLAAFALFCWLVISAQKNLPAMLLTSTITLVNAIHFIIYSAAYWSAQQADMALMLGIIIGLGISCSVSTLLYMLIKSTSSERLKNIVMSVFMAGQVAGVTILLEQINLLTGQERLWDTSSLLADDSEYGHFFNVLLGYEATPGLAYLMVYMLALVFPFLLSRWSQSFSSETVGRGSVS